MITYSHIDNPKGLVLIGKVNKVEQKDSKFYYNYNMYLKKDDILPKNNKDRSFQEILDSIRNK